MRQLSPAFIVTSLALAIASGSAFAQTTGAGLNRTASGSTTGTAVTPATTSGNSTSPTVSSGSCVGTGGSTCTSSTAATPSGNATATSAPSETVGLSGSNTTAPVSVTAPVSTASTPATTASSSDGASNLAVTSTSGAATPSSGTATTAGVLPGMVVPGVVMTPVDAEVNANGERMAASISNAPAASANPAVTPTPLFELTARQGAAKEAARRARGIEPRVYGIAPRTDRDLTHQMPDDPVIRY